MGVYLRDTSKRWPLLRLRTGKMQRLVPCVENDFQVAHKLGRVNRDLGFALFVPKAEMEALLGKPYTGPWLKIVKGGGQCTLGCQNRRPQVLQYTDANDNLCHELGHCLGLGHENFHGQNPATYEGVHAAHADAVKARYQSFGRFDQRSAMLYSDEAFAVPQSPVLQKASSQPGLKMPAVGSRCLNKSFSADDMKLVKWLYGQGELSLDNLEAHEVFWEL